MDEAINQQQKLKTVTCPVCRGTGHKSERVLSADGKLTAAECAACQGHGYFALSTTPKL